VPKFLLRSFCCLALSVALVALTAPLGSASVRVWSSASEIALPSGAQASSSTAAGPIACASSASCVTAGTYQDSNGYETYVSDIDDGTAGAALMVTPPTTASSVAVNAIACPTSSFCVGVGSYDGSAGQVGMVVPITNGVPGTAETVALPSGANSSQTTLVNSISCESSTTCYAVGSYSSQAHGGEGLVVSITNGVPVTGLEASLPGDASGSPSADLVSVACPSSTFCAATGQYQDSSGTDSLAVPINSGTPGAATEAVLPSNTDATHDSYIQVACVSATDCFGVGFYSTNATPGRMPLVVPISGGVTGSAIAVALPTGALASSNSSQSAQLNAITCLSTGACTAVGAFVASVDSTTSSEGLVVPFSNGVIGTPSESPNPTGAANQPESSLQSVACTPDGTCGAVGDYTASTDFPGVFSVAINSGVPSAATAAPLPANATTSINEPEVKSMACTSAASCTAIATYATGSSTDEVMAFSSLPQLAVATASLPSATVGTAYSNVLGTTGGDGNATWSISSGSLPAGLALNASSGLITGTPTSSGSSSFTVEASDGGPPTQSASAALSIAVVPAATSTAMPPQTKSASTPRPKLAIDSSSLTLSKKLQAPVTLACSTRRCAGVAELVHIVVSIKVEHVKVGKKIETKKIRVTISTVLAKSAFAIAAGKHATVELTPTASGRSVLASAAKVALHDAVKASVSGGITVTRSVIVR
jgi:large repetitive protein